MVKSNLNIGNVCPARMEVKAAAVNVDLSLVKIDSQLDEDLGVDSLDLVELVMAIEEEFHVEIPDEQAAGFKTVGEIVKYLESEGVQ